MPLDELLLWMDGTPRPGPENMAVDEWLLESAVVPVLRVYRWAGQWGSIGYFGKISEARNVFGDLGIVRRWTGGGFVDHRADWTYTLVVPADRPLARSKGGESYRLIHSALAAALRDAGGKAFLSGGGEQTGAALCFQNPVDHDVIGSRGEKIAGAGQRRSKEGLLHQGSVAIGNFSLFDINGLPDFFCRHLAPGWMPAIFDPEPDDLLRRCERRYHCEHWTGLR